MPPHKQKYNNYLVKSIYEKIITNRNINTFTG